MEELAEKIRHDENFRKKLEPFTHLSVEKVAETILKHLDALLSNDLKDMIPASAEEETVRGEQIEKGDELSPGEVSRVVNEEWLREKPSGRQGQCDRARPSLQMQPVLQQKAPTNASDLTLEGGNGNARHDGVSGATGFNGSHLLRL